MPPFLRPLFKTLPTLILILIIPSLCILSTLLRPSPPLPQSPTTPTTTPTSLRHLAFAIAASAGSLPTRLPYLQTWWPPNPSRAFLFLDRRPPSNWTAHLGGPTRYVVSEGTQRFPYLYRGGTRSAIRVARIVKEVVGALGRDDDDDDDDDVRWYVFGDDDTVFFVDNLVGVLGKYDHRLWYYVGSWSESVEQNVRYSFDMAFGGGGFAISAALGKVLATVLDGCLMRYGHLYGSDARVFACLAELGVGLTREPGFHQVDLRGDISGMLLAHPLAPLVSLHHLDYVEPIFPGMNRTQALKHLFESVKFDSERVLQQTVCYDRSKSWTISVSWGYAVQVFEGVKPLPDLLQLQRTFMPWKRGTNIKGPYMFNVNELPRNPCERPPIFFMRNISTDKGLIWSSYNRYLPKNCTRSGSTKKLEQIKVFSRKKELDDEQLWAPRRQCCHVVPSFSPRELEIGIRPCGNEELISIST
ncbi:hypothetical protein Sjap_025307 [Stephania japonica]|uniref:Uncharacterized protein n=1 Tax=Stephania japonica TaxID=461633 RepID=A0AAP0E1K6_9MAGN